ncbi:NUDIX hydrolase [Saccharomonospora azurea]|uniref:NTP pyrophosphohydrolase n=1 Tax=Saccharomonospora azurea NA-128 TaxID=882081 RepID=H8G6P7_9PSEU|nr:NUDIX hydrolase [Saccharomonospora azurea]EHK83347.1 NUDIX family protein [Saccharomonospora azurea SZMC 14600]EHY90317.1 NTP pyrophosphohydrolase [Saccharomonospora azurea NA-128]
MVSALHADATATLEAWKPADAAQESLRHGYLGFLAAREDACERSCAAGHLTASTVLLDASGRHILLTLHPRVGRWLQLGGHCEPEDTSLADAALREATEESGITGLSLDPEPVHLDVHPVTCSLGVPTRHFDVRFVARAPEGAQPVASDESDDLRWWPVHQLPPGTEDLTELIAAALDR